MPLDKDNPGHRNFSDKMDAANKNRTVYNKIERPIIHGVYHAGRYAFNGRNPEEWARAKDQFSKVMLIHFLTKPRAQCSDRNWSDSDRVFEETPRRSGRHRCQERG